MLSNHIEVRVEGETVWLNRLQLADLFDRDVKTIGKHISNALKEELEGIAVVAKFATTASDGKTYQVAYYNLDMIVSLGYRVKSNRGVQFRIWANKILKEYLLKGYAINSRIEQLEKKVNSLEIKNGEFGNAINNPSVKTTGEKILDEIIPKSWRDGVDSLKERNNRNKQMLEDYRNKGVIPYRSSAKGVGDPTQIEGYVAVAVNLKYPNGALETVKVNAPVRNINTGGLLTG